jgi:flagellar motor protein MotB
MARKDNSLPPEEGPPLNGWVLSFSDCMTNLLCFFVLLVSFSSFDVSAQGRIQGAFTSMTTPAISDRRTDPTDAVVPPQQRPFDPTADGAEKPTNQPPEPVRKTQPQVVPDVKAFHDQVTIRVPAHKLFWGSGDLLTPAGRSSLRLIGSYMRLLPVRAVVRPRGLGSPAASESDMRRAWSVVSCISEESKVSRDRFCIAGDAGDAGGEPVMEILLLRKEVIR